MGRAPLRAKETVWKVDVCKDVWNPELLELLVAAKQNDDSTAAWAALAHQRRFATALFADPVTLPIELHLAYELGSVLLPSHQLETIEQPESSWHRRLHRPRRAASGRAVRADTSRG
nr:RNaseH domain-containing protein [Streptomyces neyagawaensis]